VMEDVMENELRAEVNDSVPSDQVMANGAHLMLPLAPRDRRARFAADLALVIAAHQILDDFG